MNVFDFLFGKSYIERITDTGAFTTIGTPEALYYLSSDSLETVPESNIHYQYYDIRPTDIVLDIGACIGAFSLRIRNKVKQIYAVEPIMTEQLIKHIQLNKAENITVIPYGLGNGLTTVQWNSISKHVQGLPLTQLINLAGGHIDFLKCDCEGGEWFIKENELKNIRRIEMEIHLNENHPDSFYFDKILINNRFNYTKTYLTDTEFVISAGKK